MPLMDDVQFIETMKGKNTLKNIPVIGFADNLDDDSLKRYSELKIEQILSKADKINNLTKRIEENLI